jgi:tRNA-dihydrouridine synthase 1
VDLNLGCPQRIAKKGYYGAFLMDDLPRVEALVTRAAASLRVPVSCKVRLFPDLGATIAYARMLERSGCSLLAVHGRTRDMKVGRQRERGAGAALPRMPLRGFVRA